ARRGEHGVKIDEDDEDGDGHHNHQPPLRPFLAFVFARPIDVIALWQLYFATYEFHRFLHRTAQVPATDAVFDGDVTGILFAVDFRGAVAHFHLGELF